MKPKIRDVKWVLSKPLRWVISLLLTLVVTGGALFGAVSVANADDNKTIDMYSASSNLSAFFANGMQPDSSTSSKQGRELTGAWSGVLSSPATAGDLLGYTDQNLNPIQWLVTQATATTQSPLDYDTIGVSPSGAGAKQYGEFGATLKALGLDSTSVGFGSGLMSFLGGGVLLLFYWAASGVGWMFTGVLTILSWFNPFKLFYQGVHLVSPEFADGMTGGAVSDADLGPFTGLATFIGGVYKAVTSLSWAVMIPLFIGITVVGLLLFKPSGDTSRGQKIRKLFTRMVFIVVGIPLLGSMYSNILPAALNMTSSQNSGATQVVASTLVDFRAWSTQARLAVPDGATIAWAEKWHSPTDASSTSVQDSALAINKMVHPDGLKDVNPLFSLDPKNTDWTTPPGDAKKTDEAAFSVTTGLILNYIGHAQVENAGFASDVQGELTSQKVKDAPEWFKKLADSANTDGDQGADGKGELNPAEYPVLNVLDGSGLSSKSSEGVVTFTTPAQSQNTSCGAKIVAGKDRGTTPLPCNMSAMSMYNYLSTDFGDHAMTVYSSKKVSSEATQKKHDAISLVGTGGVEQFLIWLQSVVILAAFALIGFVYAIGMLIGNTKHGIQVFTATPFSLLGALPAITKVIVFVMAMVLEIFGTLFVFQIVQQLIIAFPKIVMHFFAQVTTVWFAHDPIDPSIIGLLLLPLLVIVTLISTTVMAMRLRKSIIKALNEASTKLIESLIGGKSMVPGGPGTLGKLAGAAAGGVASGAGMALGGRMMGNGKGPAAQKSIGPEAASANASGTVDGSVAGGGQQNPDPGNPAIEGGSPQGTGPGGGGALTGGSTTGTGSSTSGNAGQNIQADKELGARVAQRGLTAMPASAAASKPASKESGSQGSRSVAAGGASGTGDILDTALASHERTRGQQKEADAQKRAAATSVAGAAVHGGIAAARGAAGDAEGAARSGSKAVSGVQRAQGHVMQGRQLQKQIDASAPAQSKQNAGSGTQAQKKQVSEPEPKVQPKPQREQPAALSQVRQAPQRTLPVQREAAPDVQEPKW
ncbi:hypothetical protein [Arthrobacter bambusae]|uniref:Uncharacterized protein n=1 Tax=Arthrobacter bambusae TaxID=1338426 RepID=A0AAW8D9Q4_9MICC|nr:hypothetical protein [Arthrobacter bambusae]MDP9903208.1 hypothetical protein [Arthrobacter bambusae]MDQ0128798.1 hypothetical protein [Arthrobacter bambusae]MDQ0180139.1 hypothetical protein [Arthrobacter bambusae]